MQLGKRPQRGSFFLSKLIVLLVIASIGYVVYHFFVGYWESSKAETIMTEIFVKDRLQPDEQLKTIIVDEFAKQLQISVNPDQILIDRPEGASTVKITVPLLHRVLVPFTDAGFSLSFTSSIEEPLKVSNPFGK